MMAAVSSTAGRGAAVSVIIDSRSYKQIYINRFSRSGFLVNNKSYNRVLYLDPSDVTTTETNSKNTESAL